MASKGSALMALTWLFVSAARQHREVEELFKRHEEAMREEKAKHAKQLAEASSLLYQLQPLMLQYLGNADRATVC